MTEQGNTDIALRRAWFSSNPLQLSLGSLLWVVVAATLVLLIANPLVHLVLTSFTDKASGAWTLANYAEAFGKSRYLVAIRNSLILGFGVAALAGFFGIPIAWAVSRTDMPAKGLVRTLVLATFVTPPFLGAMSWILLAQPTAGWINRAFRGIFGTEWAPFDIYSFPGIVFVLAIYSFPYAFVFTSSALDRISSEMEEAASVLGSSRLRTLFKITLPLALPAILVAAIVTFLEAISIISSTLLVALPARVNLIPLQIWSFFAYPLRIEVAAAYSIPLVMVVIAIVGLQRLVLGRRNFVALTGKGGARSPLELGPWRWVLLAWCLFILTLSVFLPYLVLGHAAFSRAWAAGFSLHNFSLQNFAFLFSSYSIAPQAIYNTFLYSGVAATVAIVLALFIAYIASRKVLPFGNVLSAFAYVPIVVPGLILAIGFYATYAPPPFALAGTALLLIIAFITRFLPVSFAGTSSAIQGVNPEMEDAARVLGCSRLSALRRILAPLLKRDLASTWLLVFILCSREVSSALFLYGPRTRTMSVLFFDLAENGRFEVLCALGVILLLTTLIFVFIGQLYMGRDFMLRRN